MAPNPFLRNARSTYDREVRVNFLERFFAEWSHQSPEPSVQRTSGHGRLDAANVTEKAGDGKRVRNHLQTLVREKPRNRVGCCSSVEYDRHPGLNVVSDKLRDGELGVGVTLIPDGEIIFLREDIRFD